MTSPEAPKKPAASDGIAVKNLKFVAPTDVPGADVASGLKSGGPENQPRWEIVFQPETRHFRVTFLAPKREPRTWYVHETRVNGWERE